jgi:hypothetical protein
VFLPSCDSDASKFIHNDTLLGGHRTRLLREKTHARLQVAARQEWAALNGWSTQEERNTTTAHDGLLNEQGVFRIPGRARWL